MPPAFARCAWGLWIFPVCCTPPAPASSGWGGGLGGSMQGLAFTGSMCVGAQDGGGGGARCEHGGAHGPQERRQPASRHLLQCVCRAALTHRII
eukprot:121352-Pelagomonas_calceolata.AAC.2